MSEGQVKPVGEGRALKVLIQCTFKTEREEQDRERGNKKEGSEVNMETDRKHSRRTTKERQENWKK